MAEIKSLFGSHFALLWPFLNLVLRYMDLKIWNRIFFVSSIWIHFLLKTKQVAFDYILYFQALFRYVGNESYLTIYKGQLKHNIRDFHQLRNLNSDFGIIPLSDWGPHPLIFSGPRRVYYIIQGSTLPPPREKQWPLLGLRAPYSITWGTERKVFW